MTAFLKAVLSLFAELIKERIARKDTASDAETPKNLRDRWRRHIRDDIDQLRD